MKKRLSSALLFGVLLMASTSVFVSCKDYDDDINNLQTQIDQRSTIAALQKTEADLQAEITSLRTQLENKTAEINTLLQQKANTTDLQAEVTRAKAAEAAIEARLQTAENAIASLKSLVSDLQSNKVDKTTYDTEVAAIYANISAVDTRLTSAIDGLQAQLSNAIDGLQNGLKDEKTAREAVAADLAQQIEALNRLSSKADTNNAELLAQIKAAKDALQLQIDALATTEDVKKQVSAAQEALQEQIQDIYNEINVMNVFVSNQVRSIVFNPTFYFGGIEGVSIPVLKEYPILTKNGDEYTTSTSKLNISLGGIAQYWVNPSTADLEEYRLDFFTNKAVTRSGLNYITSDSAKITKDYIKDYYKNGILSVPFHADFDKINKLDVNELPIMALQMKKGDTIVTSDFAVVKPIEYSNLKIADIDYIKANANKCEAVDDINTPNSQHLHEVFADMKPTTVPATVKVKYNESVNLMKKVETHFDMTDLDGNTTQNVKMTDADFKALDLSYIFEPVDYTIGTNKTSESVHILREGNYIKDGIVTPCSVTEDGKQNPDLTGNNARAAIGKTPVVRVRLVSGDKTLAVGYFKIQIVDTTTPDNAEPAPIEQMFSNCPTLYHNCSATLDQSLTMTWSQIEANVYAKLNISKEEFETSYELDHTIDATEVTNVAGQKEISNADQFTYKQDNGENVYTQVRTLTSYIGKVKELADANDPTTNVLQWIIGESDYDKLVSEAKYIDASGNYTTDKDKVAAKVYPKELNTIVRFTKEKGTKHEEHIYVRLSIPKNTIHFAVAKIEDTKALAYWFKMNETTNADNTKEAFDVRVNVPVPTTPYTPLASTDFAKDLHNYFINNSVKTALLESNKFSKFADKTPEFQFTTPQKDVNATFSANAGTWKVKGQSGAEYTLKVNNTKDEIQTSVGATTIARLNTTTGEIVYADNKVAHDILNYVPASMLGEQETFTAYIQIVVKGDCYDVDLISDQYFNVRFLRPVNFLSVAHKSVKDAPNDWQQIRFADGAKITDWRSYQMNTTYSGQNFKAEYYGIELLVKGTDQNAMLEQIRTDANMGKTARMTTIGTDDQIREYYKKCVATSQINGLELRFQSASNNSVLEYKNNSGIADNFNMIIPVSMKYTFGKYEEAYQTHYLVVTVSKSEGQETASRVK